MKRIVMVKLAVTDEQAATLKQTLLTCNAAADVVSDVAQHSSDRRAFALQKTVYTQIKALGLSAQPAVRVIKKVADAYTTRKANLNAGNYGQSGSKRYAAVSGTAVRFRPLAAQPFDDRCLSWQLDSSTVSIWTVSGRMRVCGSCARRGNSNSFQTARVKRIWFTAAAASTCMPPSINLHPRRLCR
ncbi:hypothetical protein GCM10020255_027300 [Rhodococcus baikonurensis]